MMLHLTISMNADYHYVFVALPYYTDRASLITRAAVPDGLLPGPRLDAHQGDVGQRPRG